MTQHNKEKVIWLWLLSQSCAPGCFSMSCSFSWQLFCINPGSSLVQQPKPFKFMLCYLETELISNQNLKLHQEVISQNKTVYEKVVWLVWMWIGSCSISYKALVTWTHDLLRDTLKFTATNALNHSGRCFVSLLANYCFLKAWGAQETLTPGNKDQSERET